MDSLTRPICRVGTHKRALAAVGIAPLPADITWSEKMSLAPRRAGDPRMCGSRASRGTLAAEQTPLYRPHCRWRAGRRLIRYSDRRARAFIFNELSRILVAGVGFEPTTFRL
jgi:hypothetical protein